MGADGIFISYRRSDTASMAGRIHDRLAERLPERRLFLDVSAIRPGSHFAQRIDAALQGSAVLLVLIGSRWMATAGDASRPRVWEADDYVRHEISTALRQGLTIIPVLVDDAKMPDRDALPAEIADLAMQNAAEIRNSRFADDFEQLLAAIVGETRRDGRGQAESRRRRRLATAGGAAVGVVVLLFALALHREATGEAVAASIGLPGAVALLPVAVLVGGLAGRRWLGRGPPDGGPGRG
ncbi:MAG: toll/interleukin-1 receptor domain-containing protein [Gammaproteobacteria bacterium]|nr:toll/interleukin-1 receptor domain-containing protein [Gammaproteobacteria bacterium]